MKHFLNILTALLVFSPQAFSQITVTQQWASRYVNPYYKDADVSAMVLDSSGNVYIGGTFDKGNFNTSFLIVKYNSSGVQQWTAEYDGPVSGYDEIKKIAIDNQGNLIVTGRSCNTDGVYDLCTIKYNSSGIQQWVKRYNQSNLGNLIPTDIKTDNAGNVFVTCYNGVYGIGIINPGITVKYNSAGVQQWIFTYNYGGYPGGYVKSRYILLDNSGNIYISGVIELFEAATSYLLKLNSGGDSAWIKLFAGAGHYGSTDVSKIDKDSSGNVYAAGTFSYRSYYQNYYSYRLFKFTPAGDTLWIASYSLGTMSGVVGTIAVDNDGTSYIAGFTGTSCKIIKYNSSGVQQYVSTYTFPPEGYHAACNMEFDPERHLYTSTGYTIPNDTNEMDAFTFRLNQSGVSIWEIKYRYLNYTDAPSNILLDKHNNVYVTGRSGKSSVKPYDIFTVKYSQLVGIEPVSNQMPAEYKLHQNYPNPFNPATTIKYELPNDGIISFKIYNMTGKEVYSLNGYKKAGIYSTIFDGSDYSSGIYFYRLEFREAGSTKGSFTETRKMVLVK